MGGCCFDLVKCRHLSTFKRWFYERGNGSQTPRLVKRMKRSAVHNLSTLSYAVSRTIHRNACVIRRINVAPPLPIKYSLRCCLRLFLNVESRPIDRKKRGNSFLGHLPAFYRNIEESTTLGVALAEKWAGTRPPINSLRLKEAIPHNKAILYRGNFLQRITCRQARARYERLLRGLTFPEHPNSKETHRILFPFPLTRPVARI